MYILGSTSVVILLACMYASEYTFSFYIYMLSGRHVGNHSITFVLRSKQVRYHLFFQHFPTMELSGAMFWTLLVALGVSLATSQDVDLKLVRCLVCRTVVDEFKHEVNKIDPTREIEIGQYRLDSKGDAIRKKVPLSTSEVHLSELLETTCKKLEDYVRARYKSNNKLTLIKLMSDEGINPILSEVDIVQDGDLNKSLEHFCAEVINENEETFIEVISKKLSNAKNVICAQEAGYCQDFGHEEDDDEETGNDDNDEEDDEQDQKDEL